MFFLEIRYIIYQNVRCFINKSKYSSNSNKAIILFFTNKTAENHNLSTVLKYTRTMDYIRLCFQFILVSKNIKK